jgi:transposase-like protein
MAKGWRRWSEAEAQAALAELERTGESDVAFARRRGVSTQRLRYWRKRVETARRPAFVPVRVAETSDAGEIAIRVGGVSVCVREDFDIEQLTRIVEALGRRSRVC